MKQLFILLLLAGTCHCFGQGGKTKNDLTIVIIRHGEKYAAGSNLNCKGLNRALHIPAVINKQFGRPLLIYVPTVKTGAVTSQDRMLQTATPLAVTDSVAINSQFDETNTSGLAGYLKTQNGLQLVVWEHTNIPKLGQALGLGKDSLSWKGSDFDTIWIVTFPNGRKHAPKLVKTAEGLNGLPNQCPTGQVLSRLTERTPNDFTDAEVWVFCLANLRIKGPWSPFLEKAKSTELIAGLPAFNKHTDLHNQGS